MCIPIQNQLVFSRLILGTLLLSGMILSVNQVSAQPPESVADRLHTDVKFELLLSRERANGLAGQEWAEVFRQFEVPLRVRQPLYNDKAGVEQDIFGTTRRVVVTGLLDRNGEIVFPDRKFRLSEVRELAEWIEELKTYGAQGAPEGQPLWGLNKAEFDLLHAAMRTVVENKTSDLDLAEAIVALELPSNYPIDFTSKAKQTLGPVDQIPTVKNDLTGLAKGTAFALLLREYGLSFTPRRLPDESILLSIEDAEEVDKAWPIGWDPDSIGLTRLSLAKKLFVAVPVEVDQMSMTQMLQELEKQTEIPVFVDGMALKSMNLDFDKMTVTYPRKRTSWSLCLRTLVSKIQLTQELRVDENDQAFLWITRFQPKMKPNS
ncbi:hypothetical protein [uncultured Rubinisphaera sp.]|uniref:hypothetical protein n=1 Tax=uncultured Rubinisphaera sp. TaxID=1678686 RepID=UPI0030DB4210